MRSLFWSLFALFVVPSLALSQSMLPKVPDGFTVELVLAAPDIEAPTALTVAPNGDLYFAEDPMDMSGPPTQPIDKIWMLKNGDPKQRVLIADKMWAVMGLEIVRDKLYVVHPPYVTVFTLDADGKPIKREDLFNDLGPKVAGAPSFNDHVPSGIRMGMDGWLYVSIGDKGIPKMTRKEKDKGSVHVAEGRWRHTEEGNHISLEGGGVIRFRPDGSGLEVFASGTRNHLDVPMDEHDRIFVRDNTNDGGGWNTRLMYLPRGGFMGYPWAFTKQPNETLPAIHDFGGGSPCGGFVYCDDGLPETYQGRIFHCEWGKGKVFAVKVKPKGAGFEYVDEIKFMDPDGTALKDFRPFSLRPTADGRGFYVTDWAYSGWLAKAKAGRLWKVTYTKGDVKSEPRGKTADTIEKLVPLLAHASFSERLRIQRSLESLVITETSKKNIREAAAKFLRDPKSTPAAKRHLVWALLNTETLTMRGGRGDQADVDQLANIALEDKDATVRTEAARALGEPTNFALAVFDLKEAFNDSDARVRLNAVTSLMAGQFFTGKLEPGAVLHLSERLDDVDPTVRHVLKNAFQANNTTSAANDVFIERLREGKLGRDNALFIAMNDFYSAELIQKLVESLPHLKNAEHRKLVVTLLARNAKDRPLYSGSWWGTRPEQQPPPMRSVAWEGTPAARDALIASLGDENVDVRQIAMFGLRHLGDPTAFAPLKARFEAAKKPVDRLFLVGAMAGSKHPDAAKLMRTIALDPNEDGSVRAEALNAVDGSAGIDEFLMKLTDPKQDVVMQTKALEALLRLKLKSGVAIAQKSLTSPEQTVRQAAVIAIGAVPDPANAKLLIPMLADESILVQGATIQTLAVLKSRDAVPALLPFAGQESTSQQAITALATTPDIRAIPAYLTGLSSKNPTIRQVSRQAMIVIREPAAPILQQLSDRKELVPEALAELQSIYSSFDPIIDWKLAGPFPKDDKSYPPETDPTFDKWRTIKAKASDGEVNLAGKFDPSDNVSIYASTEIESKVDRSASLAIGSDDTITVWVNGQKVHQFNGNRGWTSAQDKVNVSLKAGKNTLLIRCGNSSGPWAFSVGITGETGKYKFLDAAPSKLSLDAYRQFVRANKGDGERGRKLFLDVKGVACIKCHAVAKEGGLVGPSLDGVGLKYNREDLMTSILEPSKTIANGYETVLIATNAGKSVSGVFKGESGDGIMYADAEGKMFTVAKKDIDEKSFSPISMMPNGLNEGMTLQDFADIIAYLEARREEKPK